MRGVALGALGNVFVLFRIVRHIPMGTDLFAAGRHVIGGSFDEIAEGSVAAETLVLRLRTQNPGENENAHAAEKPPNSHRSLKGICSAPKSINKINDPVSRLALFSACNARTHSACVRSDSRTNRLPASASELLSLWSPPGQPGSWPERSA